MLTKIFLSMFLTTLTIYGSDKTTPIAVTMAYLPEDKPIQDTLSTLSALRRQIPTPIPGEPGFVFVSDELRAKIQSEHGMTPEELAKTIVERDAAKSSSATTHRPKTHSDSWAKNIFGKK